MVYITVQVTALDYFCSHKSASLPMWQALIYIGLLRNFLEKENESEFFSASHIAVYFLVSVITWGLDSPLVCIHLILYFFLSNETGLEHISSRVVVDHRNMTDFGHGFFRLYSRGRRLKMVIKTLKKTSKSVRRYMKSWGLRKIFKKKFFFRSNSNLSETPRNQIKKLDPPLYPSPDT